MTRETFTWSPEIGGTQTVNSDVEPIKFGDGYELRIERGLNATSRTWEVQFIVPAEEAVQIMSFLKTKRGVETFYWTDPMNQLGIFLCEPGTLRSKRRDFGLYEISATFVEKFEF
jgi:phage-related protein